MDGCKAEITDIQMETNGLPGDPHMYTETYGIKLEGFVK